MFLSYINKSVIRNTEKTVRECGKKVNIQQTYNRGSFLMTVSQPTRNLALTHINIINSQDTVKRDIIGKLTLKAS